MLVPRFLVISDLHMADTYEGVIAPGLLSAFGILLLRQTFSGIPREVTEAARIDGCRDLRVFWHIMLPGSRPTMAIMAIFGFISTWNSFIWPLVVLKDDNKYPIALGVAYLAGITGTDVRSLAAGTVISIIPVVVFFIVMQRHILEGMRGAVKG
jgi:putative chitobiose transport system permease protein